MFQLLGEKYYDEEDFEGGSVELSIANKMFIKKDYGIKQSFSSALEKTFGASAQDVEFLDDGTVAIVNDWVAEKTKDKIKNLVQPGV